MKKNNKVNYVDNNKFHAAMIEYVELYEENKKKNLPPPTPSNYIGECILLIGNNLLLKPCFSGYSYKDEMRDDGVHNSLKYLHNFKKDRGKAFSYFTTIMYFAFINRIKMENKEYYIKLKNYEKFSFSLDPDIAAEFKTYEDSTHDHYSEFIKKYEESIERQKLKQKKKPNDDKKGKPLDKFFEAKKDG